MRDLGEMGESTFSLWCNQVGLACNRSYIDRYGWDFYVEFPSVSSGIPVQLHQAAIECKVQIKATDKTNRKLSIKLSNLRRLVTAPVPAFFVFIEFDSNDAALRAFLVHVDKDIISKTLGRIHQLESSGITDLHKHSITIHYGPEHELSALNGASLKAALETYAPRGMSSYVSEKSQHLNRAGYEDGVAHISFNTKGEENLVDLIDVSIGLKSSVQIANFESAHLRFGIKTRDLSMQSSEVILEMPDLKPSDTGKIIFRESRLSPGISFPCRYYYSPLNPAIPKRLIKIRIEADSFDLAFNPFTGAVTYRFFAGQEGRLELKELKNVVKLMHLLSSKGQQVLCDMVSTKMKTISFSIKTNASSFPYDKMLEALNRVSKISEYFDLTEPLHVSLEEVFRDAHDTDSFILAIAGDPREVRCTFSIDGAALDPSRKTVCIMVGTTRIGQHLFGLIIALMGKVTDFGDGRYSILSDNIKVEQKFVSNELDQLNRTDLIAAVEEIETRYEAEEYQVIINLDKSETRAPQTFRALE